MSESVIRFRRGRGFTTVYNSVAQDGRLSLATRGLFTLMASLPDDWDYTVSGLAKKANTSRYEIRKCLEQMQLVGYLMREQGHDAQGKFTGNVYVLQDQAPESGAAQSPLYEIATTAKYRQRNLTLTENLTQQKKDINKIPNQTPHCPQGLDESFLTFWDKYPKKVKKKKAWMLWQKLRPDDALVSVILDALDKQKRSERWQREDGKYIPDPTTWLNGSRWEDELPESPARPEPEKEAYGWE